MSKRPPRAFWYRAWSPSAVTPPASPALPQPVAFHPDALKSTTQWAGVALLLVAWFVFLAPPQAGGHTLFAAVEGHSMEPVLHPGDLLVTRAQDSYAPGDLVVFRVQGVQVVHRIVGGSPHQGWVTRGDNNAAVDPWTLPNAAVLGKATFWVRGVGGWCRAVVAAPAALGLSLQDAN